MMGAVKDCGQVLIHNRSSDLHVHAAVSGSEVFLAR